MRAGPLAARRPPARRGKGAAVVAVLGFVWWAGPAGCGVDREPGPECAWEERLPTTDGITERPCPQSPSTLGMVRIPKVGDSTTFPMGSPSLEGGIGSSYEHHQEWVTLPAFYIDRKEVTLGDFMECVEAKVCYPPGDEASAGTLDALLAKCNTRLCWPHVSPRSSTLQDYCDECNLCDYPVNCVEAWNLDEHGAFSYCRWRGKSLPTDLQWERAAKGGEVHHLFPWGDQCPLDWSRPGQADWEQYQVGEMYMPGCTQEPWQPIPADHPYSGMPVNACHRDTQPEDFANPGPISAPWEISWTYAGCDARLDKTAEGVCDMAGNLREWVIETVRDGKAGLRGGAFDTCGSFLRTSRVKPDDEEVDPATVGFRCVVPASEVE